MSEPIIERRQKGKTEAKRKRKKGRGQKKE